MTKNPSGADDSAARRGVVPGSIINEETYGSAGKRKIMPSTRGGRRDVKEEV
jgi:hypothetical protein